MLSTNYSSSYPMFSFKRLPSYSGLHLTRRLNHGFSSFLPVIA